MAEILKAIESLLLVLFDEFGAWNTVLVMLGAYILLFLRRLYHDWRKEQYSDRAHKAMEESVQRSAQEAREWRVLFLMEKAGWSLEDAERVVSEGKFSSPREARRTLEKKPVKGKAN